MRTTQGDFGPLEMTSGVDVDLAEIWRELKQGQVGVIASLCSQEFCYLKLRRRTPPAAAPCAAEIRNMELLERWLLGEPQKCLALDARLSASSVAFALSNASARLGISRGPGRMPLAVALALQCARGVSNAAEAKVSWVGSPALGDRIVRAQRPDFMFKGSLSAAELEVARLKIDGKTHAEIALLRKAAPRTIANQLGSVYAKCGVSGRFQLLAYFVRGLTLRRGALLSCGRVATG